MTPEELKGQIEGQVAELKKIVTETTAKVAEDSKANIEDQKAQIAALTAKMVANDEAKQKHLDELQGNFQKLKEEGAGAKAAQMNIGQMIVKNLEGVRKEDFEHFKTSRRPFSWEQKDAATMVFGTQTSGQVVDNAYVPGIFGTQRRNVRMRTLLPMGMTTGDKVPFVYQTGGEGAAAATLEGAGKTLFDKDIALKEAPVRKIAGYARISEELLNDLPAIQAFITNQGVEDLLDAEDTMILTGANDTAPSFTGLTINALTSSAINANVTTSNPNKWDAIIGGLSALAASNYSANAIVVNPVDYYSMLMSKATSGGEYHNGNILIAGGVIYIAGIPVSVSTAITAGSFLLGDFARGAQLFQRDGISVRFYDQDQDNAIKNLVTIVIEERLTLARYYPSSFFYDTYSDVITAITAS